MNTFLPYPDFKNSLTCLDNKRLGKQRVEAKQILDILDGKESKWKNHPAVKMWIGYRECLAYYYNMSLAVWELRGFKNEKLQFVDCAYPEIDSPVIVYPPWFRNYWFHLSHRSNLLRKDFNTYCGKEDFDLVPNDIPYVWPGNKVIPSVTEKQLTYDKVACVKIRGRKSPKQRQRILKYTNGVFITMDAQLEFSVQAVVVSVYTNSPLIDERF